MLAAMENVQYQPFGGVKSYTLGNGQIYSRTIDQDGRIASYTLGASTYGITFDAASRITGIAETGNSANANTYGYDTLDRLTSAVLPSSSFGYSYDAVGNWHRPGIPDTFDRWEHDIGGVRWEEGHLRRSSSVRR